MSATGSPRPCAFICFISFWNLSVAAANDERSSRLPSPPPPLPRPIEKDSPPSSGSSHMGASFGFELVGMGTLRVHGALPPPPPAAPPGEPVGPAGEPPGGVPFSWRDLSHDDALPPA